VNCESAFLHYRAVESVIGSRNGTKLVETIDCIPWDAAIGQRWAALVVELKRKGETVPLLDGMIAATALQHDLIVATRNTRHFQKTHVKTSNPFV
jgi:predicted nucleic acid-binding protein